MATIAEIQDLTQFLTTLSDEEREQSSIGELFELWHWGQTCTDEDFLALEASIRDFENGERGQPVDEFLAEVKAERQRRQLARNS